MAAVTVEVVNEDVASTRNLTITLSAFVPARAIDGGKEHTATQSSWLCTRTFFNVTVSELDTSKPSALCAAGNLPLRLFGASPAELSSTMFSIVKPRAPLM